MSKGSSNKFRSGGNGRAGLRDCPVDPGRMSADQRARAQALHSMRSLAAKRGHETRRAREVERLLDELGELLNVDDLDDDAAL